MGLDWCVNIYKNDDCDDFSLKQVEGTHEELGYTGQNYFRGKVVQYIIMDYGFDAEVCFGEDALDYEGNERGPFLTEKCIRKLNIISKILPYRELKEENGDECNFTIEEQKEAFKELNQMADDVREYNDTNKDYYALIWCWY